MYCENCGAKIDDDSRFCENCGAVIESEISPDSEPQGEAENIQDVEQLVRDETLSDLNELMYMDAEDEDAASSARETLEKTMVFVKSGEKKKEKADEQVFPAEAEIDEEDREFAQADEEPKEKAPSYGLPEEEVEALSALMPEVSGQNRFTDIPELEEIFSAAQNPAEGEAEEEALEEAEGQPEEMSEKMPIPEEESEEVPQENLHEEEEVAEEAQGQDQAEAEDIAAEYEPEPQHTVIPEFPEEEMPLQKEETEETFTEEPAFTAEGEAVEEEPAEEATASERPIFCMACGRRLPEGAAFCDACGTATGEVEPSEAYKRRAAGQGVFSLVKNLFLKPASTLEKSAGDDAFVAGTVFLLVKDVILAVLSSLFMSKLSVTLGAFGSWLVNGDPFGFAAKIFLCAVLLDALWIGVLYGAGYLFKAHVNIKVLLGACGTASLFTAVLLIAAVVVTALFPPSAFCAAAVTGVVTLVTMTKAAASALKLHADKLIYLMAAAGSVYTIILFIAGQLLAR